MLRCWFSFEVGSAGSGDHSAYDYSALSAASGIAEHQVFLQSIHGTHSCFPFSLPPGIQVSFPSSKQELPVSFLLLPGTTSRAAVCSISSFLGPLKQAYVLHISVYYHILGRDKKKCEKVHRGSKSDFESHEIFSGGSSAILLKGCAKQKIQFRSKKE